MQPMAADDNRRMSSAFATNGVVRLAHWGLMRARGADAARFLHGQLTNDMLQLGADRAVPAGFCSAKGRLQASFIVWHAGADELLLACAADLLAPTLKRLSMFVLRAQCKLGDASAGVTFSITRAPSFVAWIPKTSQSEGSVGESSSSVTGLSTGTNPGGTSPRLTPLPDESAITRA